MTDETGGRRGPTRPRPRPLPGIPAPLLGLAAALSLALAALCLHATGGSPLHGTGPLVGGWVLIALAALVGGMTVAVKYRVRQEERPRMTVREERITLAAFAGMLGVLAVTVIGVVLSGTGQASGARPLPPLPPTTVPTPVVPTPSPSAVTRPMKSTRGSHLGLMHLLVIGFYALLAVLFVVILVMVVRWLRSSGRPAFVVAEAPVVAADEERLADAISAGRLALRGDDTRAAIIACYAAMEASLAANGLGRRAADSPSDLLERATGAGLVEGAAAETLADLFREARYSSHVLDPAQLEAARTALDRISDHLARHQAQADAPADAGQKAGTP